MKFENMLKNNKYKCYCGSLCGPFSKVIKIKDLGEWALSEETSLLKSFIKHKISRDVFWFNAKKGRLTYKIALVCLGEKRVKHKLKELEKSKV